MFNSSAQWIQRRRYDAIERDLVNEGFGKAIVFITAAG